MKRYIFCPVCCCDRHEIIDIKIEKDRFGDEQHTAEAFCDAIGKTVIAKLELVRRPAP